MADGACRALLDPHCKYAHAEAEIAYLELFQTITPAFLRAYQRQHKLPAEYHRIRKPVYQLFSLINHLHLFGQEYLKSVMGAVDKVGIWFNVARPRRKVYPNREGEARAEPSWRLAVAGDVKDLCVLGSPLAASRTRGRPLKGRTENVPFVLRSRKRRRRNDRSRGEVPWKPKLARKMRLGGSLALPSARRTRAWVRCVVSENNSAPERGSFRAVMSDGVDREGYAPFTTSMIAWVLMTICVSSKRWKLCTSSSWLRRSMSRTLRNPPVSPRRGCRTDISSRLAA